MAFRSLFDSHFQETGLTEAYFVTVILGVLLQISGQWVFMIPVGAIGSFFVKRLKHAIAGGFLGVGTAWACIFLFLNITGNAYAVGEYFATLIGLPGMGRWIVSFSIVIGGLLGATGALVGRSLFDILEDRKNSNTHKL
ncbi:MAG: hypothetical protein RTU30_15555 [Candidatus Thorarchaeota archaeon]